MLLRGVGTQAEVQVAISRCFGTLEHHPVKEVWVDGHSELIALDYVPPAPGDRPVAPVYRVAAGRSDPVGQLADTAFG